MSVKLTLEGTGGGAVKALTDLNKAIEKTEKGLTLTAREAKKLENAAGQVVKANEQPLDRYNRRIAETAKLVAAGKLSHDDAAKAALRYKMSLDGVGKAGSQLGRDLGGHLRNIATETLAIFSATKLATEGIQKLNAERMQAADSVKSAQKSGGTLAQLAANDPDPKRAQLLLKAEASKLFAMGATETKSEANSLLFDLASADLSGEERTRAARMQALGVLPNAAAAAEGASGMRIAFGAKEAGTFLDQLDKATAVGKIAPGSVDTIMKEVGSKAGGIMSQLGWSDEFAYASSAVNAKPSGSISQGSTLSAAFAKGIADHGAEFAGLSGIETVEALRAKNLDREGLKKYLGGSSEAMSGYQFLSENLDLLKKTEADIYAADKENRIQRAIEAAESDRSVTIPLSARINRNRLLLGQEREGEAGTLVDSLLDKRYDIERRASPGLLTEMMIGSSRGSVALRRGMGESNISILEELLNKGFTAPDDRQTANELLGRLNENMERQNTLMEENNDLVRAGNRKPLQDPPRPHGRPE